MKDENLGKTPKMHNLKVIPLQDIRDLDDLNTWYPPQADIAEVSGAGARSRLAIRRKLVGGTIMVLVVTADLTLPSTRVQIEEYIGRTPVAVAILVPTYHPYRARPQRDWWYMSASTDQRHMAQVCGQLAAHQLSKGPHILVHQPRTSDLFQRRAVAADTSRRSS